jgi:hypothetical protein
MQSVAFVVVARFMRSADKSEPLTLVLIAIWSIIVA